MCFNDDGEGMSPTDAIAMFCMDLSGHPGSQAQPLLVYGDRLATAAFRLSNDMVFFAKVRPVELLFWCASFVLFSVLELSWPF